MDQLMSFGYLQLLRKVQKNGKRTKIDPKKKKQTLGKMASRLFMLFFYSD